MIKNANFSGYCFYMNTNIWVDFQICISVPLTLDEINCAKCLLIKSEQKGFLCNNGIKKELANNLSVFLDKNGLLCVKGRVQNLLFSYEIKTVKLTKTVY